VTESKRIEQKSKMMKEFMQEFKRVARGRYEERLLIKEFKQGINRTI